jgi:quinolinate synthase
VKAVSTLCCTSANALSVVNSLDADEILMVPDRNLAQYTASRTGKTVHYWNGFCPAHQNLTLDEVFAALEAHPEADFMAHPECRPEVLALADAVLSTSGMLKYAKDSDKKAFIVGTEQGILYPLRKQNPEKAFYKVSDSMVCRDMKKLKLTDILTSLRNMRPEVSVSKEIQEPAFQAVQRMLKN